MIALSLLPDRRIFTKVSAFLALTAAVLCFQSFRLNSTTQAVFFDVPGESILVTLPGGYRILIDGGMTPEVVEKTAGYIPFWDKSIDAIIITHTDTDHLFGVSPLFDHYSIKNVFITGAAHESELYHNFREKLRIKNIPVINTDSTTDIRMGDAHIDIVYPSTPLLGKQTASINSGSIVGRISIRGSSLLFTGDIGKKEERNILSQPVKISSTILDSPHHGSKNSNSREFLIGAHPERAVASASDPNPFGHPHQEVINEFLLQKIPLQITGKSGDIHILFTP